MRILSLGGRRLGQLALVMLGTVTIVFVIGRVIPGDPARTLGGPDATEAQLDVIRREHGLDQPVARQFLTYLAHVLGRADLGRSIRTQRPVAHDLALYFPATFELTTVALLLAAMTGIGLGLAAAVWRGSWLDHATRLLAVSGVSLPLFWIGLLLQVTLRYTLAWLPISGRLDAGLAMPRPPVATGLLTVDALLAGDLAALRSGLAGAGGPPRGPRPSRRPA